jgi:hypothetical protein
MDIFIQIDETNRVIGWSSSEDQNSILVSVPDNNHFFIHPFVYHYENGELVYNEETHLRLARVSKMRKLKVACDEAILGRFTCTVDGVEYQFSCDEKAQSNFEKVDRAFEKGRVTVYPWTAYDADGNVVRLVLDVNTFEDVYVAHLNHIGNCVSKLRDDLEKKVNAAQGLDELIAVKW